MRSILKITKKIFVAFYLLLACSFSASYAYDKKEITDFKELDSFKSVEQFEKYIEKYTQKCLDNSYGGTDGIPCFIGYEIWDRELNTYYNKLYSILEKNEKKKLKESQRSWLKTRDLSLEFSKTLLNKIYTESGTMYLLMRAGDADSMISAIIKQRALTLKIWLDSIK